MDNSNSNLALIVELLQETRTDIQSYFKSLPDYSHLGIYIDSQLQTIINKTAHLAGVQSSIISSPVLTAFPPITSFMGEDLNVPTSVQAEALEPTLSDIEILENKVSALYLAFSERSSADLLDNEDEITIRGLAKRAGITDYKTAPLDYNLLADIGAAIKRKEAKAQEEKLFNDILEAERIAALTPKPEAPAAPEAPEAPAPVVPEAPEAPAPEAPAVVPGNTTAPKQTTNNTAANKQGKNK